MQAVEFTTELNGTADLKIPREAMAQLPKSGQARDIVLTVADTDDEQWRRAAYE